MISFRFYFRFALLIFVFAGFISCAGEEPGQPKTAGASQFVGDGFAFKYPDNADLRIRREDEWALRRIEVAGPEIELEGVRYPGYAFTLESFGPAGTESAREFAESRIMQAYEAAREAGEPAGAWPVNPETGAVEGRRVRVHGLEGWEVRVPAGDAELVRRFVIGPESGTAVALSYRDIPEMNNPLAPLHYSMYVMALETLRVE